MLASMKPSCRQTCQRSAGLPCEASKPGSPPSCYTGSSASTPDPVDAVVSVPVAPRALSDGRRPRRAGARSRCHQRPHRGRAGAVRRDAIARHPRPADRRRAATDADVDELRHGHAVLPRCARGTRRAGGGRRGPSAAQSHEVDPYRGLAPHLQVASARAARTGGDCRRRGARGRGIGAGAAAAAGAARSAGVGDGRPRARRRHRAALLAEQLVEAGYTREDPVDEHGEFCVRGGIVDVFPPGDAEPIRIEFIGDTVESIRRYDPSTQRSTRTIDQARIVPDSRAPRRRPTAPAVRDAAPRMHRLRLLRPSAGRATFVVAEPDEVCRGRRHVPRADRRRAIRRVTSADQDHARRGAGSRGAARRGCSSTTDTVSSGWQRRAAGAAGRRCDSAELKFGPTTALGRPIRQRTTRALPAGPRVQRPRAGLHRGVRAARSRRAGGVRRDDARAAPSACSSSARDYQVIACAADRGRRRAPRPRCSSTIGHLARGFRLPEGGLVDLCRGRCLRGGAPRPRAAAPALGDPASSSPICATSRSATTSCTSITASARSSGSSN